MSESSDSALMRYPSGAPSWAEFSARDLTAFKAFYLPLFGWQVDAVGPEDPNDYLCCMHKGQMICGGALCQGEDVPSHWKVYITVDDLDATVEKVRKEGGTVPADPFPVMDIGRMSVIRDRQGAMLCLWSPLTHHGAHAMQRPGALAWFELSTADPSDACDFYRAVLGVSVVHDSSARIPYTRFEVDGMPVAGVIKVGDGGDGTYDWSDTPSHWGVYFGVDDIDKALIKVQELGGRVCMGSTDISVGHIAVIADTENVVSMLMHMNHW